MRGIRHSYTILNEEDVDEELQCNICCEPCLDPVVLPCCENMVCRKCLKTADCPFDRQPLPSLLKEPQRIIRNMLERVKVRCNACEKQIKRGVWAKRTSS